MMALEDVMVVGCHGSFKHSPLKIVPSENANIIIIAGDISDDMDMTVNWLNDISSNYETILLVDGNHEHVSHYKSRNLVCLKVIRI